MNQIVPICEDNLQQAVSLAEDFHAHMPTSHTIAFDPEHTTMWGRWAMAQDTHFCQLALDDDMQAVGLIVGTVSMLLYAPHYIGMEEVWYVKKVPFRAKHACALMHAFIKWCHEKWNVADIRTGSSAFEIARGDILLRHLGFKRSGLTYSLHRSAEL